MQGDFDEAKAFSGRDAPPEIKVEAWQRFVQSYAADDPESNEVLAEVRHDPHLQLLVVTH